MDTETLILAAAQIASGMVATVDPRKVASGAAGSEPEQIAKAAVAIARAIAEEADS